MAAQECGLCSKRVEYLLEHLVLEHHVKNAEDFIEMMNRKGADDARARRFREYVRVLGDALAAGKMSAEEYRRRVVTWTE